MKRLLIAASAAALLAAAAAPAFADYPPCTHPGQDSCRVVNHGWGHMRPHGHHHHHHGHDHH